MSSEHIKKVKLTPAQRDRAADLLERVVGDDDALEALVYCHIALMDRDTPSPREASAHGATRQG